MTILTAKVPSGQPLMSGSHIVPHCRSTQSQALNYHVMLLPQSCKEIPGERYVCSFLECQVPFLWQNSQRLNLHCYGLMSQKPSSAALRMAKASGLSNIDLRAVQRNQDPYVLQLFYSIHDFPHRLELGSWSIPSKIGSWRGINHRVLVRRSLRKQLCEMTSEDFCFFLEVY